MDDERSSPHCELCGDVIGVYEPLIHVIGEMLSETSRAAQPGLFHGATGSCYHAPCFESLALDG